MELLQQFGERVRRRRMALGLSQTDFAKQAGIPVPRLSSIEHGHQSIYIERLIELAKALNVSADYLLGLSDDPHPRRRRRKSVSSEQLQEDEDVLPVVRRYESGPIVERGALKIHRVPSIPTAVYTKVKQVPWPGPTRVYVKASEGTPPTPAP